MFWRIGWKSEDFFCPSTIDETLVHLNKKNTERMPSNKFYITKGSLYVSPNDFGNPNMVRVSTLGKCALTYYNSSDGLSQEGTEDYLYPSWSLNARNIKFYNEPQDKLYLYAACLKKDKSGIIIVSGEVKPINPEGDYYYISIGYFSPVEGGKRIFFPDFGILLSEKDGIINDSTGSGIWEKRKDSQQKDTAYTKLPVISEESMQAPVIGPFQRTYDESEKWSTKKAIDYETGLFIAGNLINVFYRTGMEVGEVTDNMVMSAKMAMSEFLSKRKEDHTDYLLGMRAGAEFGLFSEGITGTGASIAENGEAWLGSLHLRHFLEVPELRYNRISIQIGDTWSSPGAGIIESVDVENQIITLKLEEGEIGTVAIDDICMGIFHSMEPTDNSGESLDDGRGNRKFTGFATCYFRIVDVLDAKRNSRFRYVLRGVSDRWSQSIQPMQAMNFVGYGNFSNKERQTSSYATRTYQRYLREVSDWEFSAHNIAAQFGDLSNLSAFGINMVGYSAYLNNIYMTGVIDQSAHLPDRMEFDSSNGLSLSLGEQTAVTPYLYNAWDDVSSKYEQFIWTRDSGNTAEDAAWNIAHKESMRVLVISFNDLNINRVVFSCTASKPGAKPINGNVIV